VDAKILLAEIADYCRRVGMAESTFGRRAVNDGKLVGRLRFGRRVTLETAERVRSFIHHSGAADATPAPTLGTLPLAVMTNPAERRSELSNGSVVAVAARPFLNSEQTFRFFDNRQKYLLFVNTCSEKWVIARRVAMELANIHPRPPAIRIFDAGVGDGTVLTRVMRAMHQRFPTLPSYVVGKEISLEDVRLVLDKIPDRLFEHPATVLVLTNMYYSEAPWLAPGSMAGATGLIWHEHALTGTTAHDFEQHITDLQPFLAQHWRARIGPSGNPIYDRPVVLVIYRDDHRFLLDPILPKPGGTQASYDLVIASQPYRARSPIEFKTRRVIAPLARALGPGGRLIAIHSHGNDPGLEIVQRLWPGDNPFIHDRHQIMKAVKQELGAAGRELNFNVNSDNRALFRYDMHTLPSEVSDSIGTSTLFAAWNAAIYVAQVEDHRLAAVVNDRGYLDATRDVLRRNGGLWFFDESYVISRRRG